MTTVERKERKKRVPVSGPRDILSVPNQDPNYVYRWVRDEANRINRFKDGGYEVVTADLEVGQPAVDRNTKLGSSITQTRGTVTLVLMRIPKEWYDEDQVAKQDEIDALEATMKKSAEANKDYGTLKITRK